MPKVGMAALRRDQLVTATLKLIHEQGLSQTTVSQISARAGLSDGMVHHYFANKDELMEVTLRSLNKRMCSNIVRGLDAAKSPRDRIVAIIDSNLCAENFTAETVTAWLAFWSQVPTTPRLARVHNVVRRRVHSNFMFALRQLTDEADVERVAVTLEIFCDGLYLRAAVDPDGLSSATALDLVYEMLDRMLPKKAAPQR